MCGRQLCYGVGGSLLGCGGIVRVWCRCWVEGVGECVMSW